ncbi:MAG: LysR family transcriptional regulator [Betaproteobacteria bacterium]|nr:LysR family transcriptional regulator [Betaproteobacteria bacterium]
MPHRIGPTKLRIHFGEDIAMGPGKAALLEAIRETGSISAAGKRLGMSYKRAWNLVDLMNRSFRMPLVDTATGGGGGGGARLTMFAETVLDQYRAMQSKADTALKSDLKSFAGLLAKH